MRRINRISAGLLAFLLLVQGTGCSTFQPVRHPDQVRELAPQQQHLRVAAADGFQYFFPRGQYRIEPEAGTPVSIVKGWGDKLGAYGLIDRGYFEVRLDSGSTLEVEEIDVARSVLFSGILLGAAGLTYLGVRMLSSASGKGSEPPAPPPAN